eukprot:scaffold158120_cov41-Tisochrysis_lutea.AAC.2
MLRFETKVRAVWRMRRGGSTLLGRGLHMRAGHGGQILTRAPQRKSAHATSAQMRLPPRVVEGARYSPENSETRPPSIGPRMRAPLRVTPMRPNVPVRCQ